MALQTFLELCKRTARECGVAGSGPTSVTSQVGEHERVVNWVKDAYLDIQNLHQDWDFLWGEDYLVLDSGVSSYTAPFTDNAIRDFDGVLTIYDTAVGDSDKSPLKEFPYRVFRQRYLDKARTTRRPVRISVKPNETALLVDPVPDQAGYRIDYAYWRDSHILTDGTDQSLIPEKHNMIIVWRAVMKYAQYEEASVLLQTAELEYNRALGALQESHLPKRVIQMRPMA